MRSVGKLRDYLSKFLKQHFGFLQIARVKPFGEPAVHRSEKLASLIPLALVAPEAGEFGSSAKL
jgi:hypothetical protein